MLITVKNRRKLLQSDYLCITRHKLAAGKQFPPSIKAESQFADTFFPLQVWHVVILHFLSLSLVEFWSAQPPHFVNNFFKRQTNEFRYVSYSQRIPQKQQLEESSRYDKKHPEIKQSKSVSATVMWSYACNGDIFMASSSERADVG